MTNYDLINLFEKSQNDYLLSKETEYLKKNSQFFTPASVVHKMIKTIDLNYLKEYQTLRILEPSAGCGILILYLILDIIENLKPRYIYIEAYEIDPELCTILNINLTFLKSFVEKHYDIVVELNILKENFILANTNSWKEIKSKKTFDIIISNPPFNKINQSAAESLVLSDIVYGQPNIYGLFIGLSLKMLADNGQYVVISPRSYLNGNYSKKLRKFMFTNYRLTNLHSFDNRNIFSCVNQEIIISTFIRDKKKAPVQISYNGKSSLNTDFENLLWNYDSFSLILPKKPDDFNIIDSFSIFDNTLSDINMKVSVGPVVQFRNEGLISKETYSDSFAPLLISKDIQENNEIYYHKRKNLRNRHNKSINIKSSQLIRNSNYVILRKVTAKDDKNTIIAAVLEKNFFDHSLLGLDNNLLYFHSLVQNLELSKEDCYGLYCIINSVQFSELFSLIIGTHTINVSDFSEIMFPNRKEIRNIGKKVILKKKYDKKTCTNILSKHLME